MKWRIKKDYFDGKPFYIPQYKRFIFWCDFPNGFIGGEMERKVFDTLWEAEEFLNTYPKRQRSEIVEWGETKQ